MADRLVERLLKHSAVRENSVPAREAMEEAADRIATLKAGVEAAYREGFARGMTEGSLVCIDENWSQSITRSSLEKNGG